MQRGTVLLLSVIVSIGLGVRLGYLAHATSQARYQWDDPDHYDLKAKQLAGGADGWQWSFDVVRHGGYGGRTYVLPPGYPVFLSAFASLPGYPRSAQIGQAVLSAATVLLLFVLGRDIHSVRAGLIAAAVYALWLPNIIAVWSTMQESLFVPLVVASFVLLLRGLRDGIRPGVLALAGLTFGIATLTRSIPLYAMPLFAVAILSRGKKAILGVALLGAGFLLATLPYSVILSLHLGQPTFVENHGSIFIVERYGGPPGTNPATSLETASILFRAFVDAPGERIDEMWTATRSILHINGGRLLQIYLGAATALGASISRLAVQLFADTSFLVSLLLAPLGFALSRRRDLAMFAVLWIALCWGLTAVSGFGGARLRAPFEPHLIVLAAVVLAGQWRKPATAMLVTTGGLTLILAVLVVPQIPGSFRARGDYGVHWPLRSPPKRSRMEGKAGFNLLPTGGSVRFHVRPRNPSRATQVEVRLDGELVERVRLGDAEHRFDLSTQAQSLVHIEVTASDSDSGEPVALLVIVPAHL